MLTEPERCPSGLWCRSRKAVGDEPRGFESHPLRQALERCWSGLSGAPGERVSPLATVGSNPTLSAILDIFFTISSNFLFAFYAYATMFQLRWRVQMS